MSLELLCGLLLLSTGQDLPRMEYEGTYDSIRLQAELDYSVILRSWRIKGVLVCLVGAKPQVCLWVENAYPSGIFEVVRQPLRSHFRGEWQLTRLFSGLLKKVQSRHGEDLQFADVRVWTFVPELLQDLDIPIAAPETASLRLEYWSETDVLGWRRPEVDAVLRPGASLAGCENRSTPRFCAGPWGGYYPRTGFVVRGSEVLASFLQGLRGGRVASDPAGRLVTGRYSHEPRTGHYVQMLSPVRREAVAIGNVDVAGMEREAVSKRGAYLFAHFGVFEACRRCLPVKLTPERAVR